MYQKIVNFINLIWSIKVFELTDEILNKFLELKRTFSILVLFNRLLDHSNQWSHLLYNKYEKRLERSKWFEIIDFKRMFKGKHKKD